jgi:hypothetical protein
MEPSRVIRGDCEILLLPVIRGLVTEEVLVERHAREFLPDAVALSISPEELKALREHDGNPLEPLCGTIEENVYETGLGKFGQVERPPRCFIAAIKRSAELNARVVGVDLTEEEFTRSYVSLVSGWDFVRRALGRSHLSSARFAQSSAEAFVLDWDRKLRKRLLAIVELERAKGVLERLESKADETQ